MGEPGSHSGGQGLAGKAFLQLSADAWGCAPSLVVWPEVTHPGICWLCGRVNGDLHGAYAKGCLPGLLLPVCPCDEPVLARASTGDPLTLAGGFGSVSCGITVSFLCARLCLCPLRLESLFLPVLWRSYSQIPLAFKAEFPGDSQSLCPIPRLGSLMWSSEHSQQWENLFGITAILQFVGHPSGGYRI